LLEIVKLRQNRALPRLRTLSGFEEEQPTSDCSHMGWPRLRPGRQANDTAEARGLNQLFQAQPP
jgi:hypothetical protein